MEKKNWITLVVVTLVVVGLFTLCFFVEGDNSDNTIQKREETETTSTDVNSVVANAQKESAEIKDSEMDELDEIDVDEYLEMYSDSDELELVYVARPTCSYCQIAEPIVRKLDKDYDLDINYLNTDEFKGNDQNDFIKSDDLFAEGFGTPMLLLVGKDSIVDYVDGLSDTAGYKDFFKKNDLIK